MDTLSMFFCFTFKNPVSKFGSAILEVHQCSAEKPQLYSTMDSQSYKEEACALWTSRLWGNIVADKGPDK